jgi:hypothetical protein
MATSNISYKSGEYAGQLGMVRRFSRGIHGQTAVSFFEEVEATDGGKVRMKGGQAPSAYTSDRGAAGAFNRILCDRCDKGATWAELVHVAEHAGLGKGGVKGDPEQRVVDHLRSFFLQAEERRASANGLKQAVRANGWNWSKVQANALLIDGKAWNGQAIKRAVLPNSVILPIVLIAVNYKATPSLVKALGLTD